jgi:hypothetical protein
MVFFHRQTKEGIFYFKQGMNFWVKLSGRGKKPGQTISSSLFMQLKGVKIVGFGVKMNRDGLAGFLSTGIFPP